MMRTQSLILTIASLVIAMPTLAIELIGSVHSKHGHTIVAEVNGVVANASLEPGEKVQANDLLADIKTDDFKVNVAKKRAHVELANADLKHKQSTYDRYTELANKNSLSRNELDIAKAEYLSAKANLTLAQIELKQAEQDLADALVHTPIEGFVVERAVQRGDWVNQGDLLYKVVNIDNVTVRLLASEYDMTQLKVGQALVLWPEINPDYKVHTTIKRIGVQLDSRTHAYPVEVDIANPQFQLKPNMSIYATTDVASHQ